MKKRKKKNSKEFNRKFKKRFITKKSLTVLAFASLVLVVIGFGCKKQKERAMEYEKAIQELSTDIQELKDTNETLEKERNDMDSDEFKEKMARERLGMIRQDEYSLQQSENGEQEETTKTGREESSTNGEAKEEESSQNAASSTKEEVSAEN